MGKFEEQDFDERRLARRQRRKKSQIKAFIVLGLILILIVGAIGGGAYYIKGFITNWTKSLSQAEAPNEATTDDSTEVVVETPTEENENTTPMTDEELLDQIVNSCIGEMPLEDKVAGLFIITPEQLTGVDTAVKAGSGTQEALSTYAVGGIVYSAKNIKSEEQIIEMLSTTASMSKYPIFTVVREDGTESSSVTSSIGISDIVEYNGTDSATANAKTVGNFLFRLGFNFNLSPIMDFSENRAFGTDPSEASKMASAFTTALQEMGITACASTSKRIICYV